MSHALPWLSLPLYYITLHSPVSAVSMILPLYLFCQNSHSLPILHTLVFPTVMSLAISQFACSFSMISPPLSLQPRLVFGWVLTHLGIQIPYFSLGQQTHMYMTSYGISSLDILKNSDWGMYPNLNLAHPFFYPPTCSLYSSSAWM